MKSFFRWIFRILLYTFLFVTLLVVSVAFLEIPIDLTMFKDPVAALASKALKREVHIEKSIVISTSLNPVFTLGGLRIDNPDGFSQETFVSLDSALIRVDILALLQKKIHISEISVQKLHVTLEENTSGEVNWAFATDNAPAEVKQDKKEVPHTGIIKRTFNLPGDRTIELPVGITFEMPEDILVVSELTLEDIVLNYYGPGSTESSQYQIDKCLGSMDAGKPMNLDITGSLNSSPYTLTVNIASFGEFLTENRSWMEIKAAIGGAELLFSGDINLAKVHRSLALKGSVSGENLNTLNELLQLDLPPMTSYGVKADLLLKKDLVEMKNLVVKTGSSSLKGTALIKKDKAKTEIVIELISPFIQVNDFIFDDWSWSEEEEAADGGNRKPFDSDVLDDFDVTINIRSEKVALGDDELGSGILTATVRDGRISVDPLKLNVPGGTVELAVSLKPGAKRSDASLRVVMSNFDIGILARKNNPDSKMGGLVNLDVDLQSSATSFDQILANGNGYLDFSGQLTNFKSGIIDLWAVNLIASIVSSTDENESNINCAVGRWQVNDGSLTPDLFFIDTSKIRICGSGVVDFMSKEIDMTISPAAKKPEFFSIATPLKVHGTFSDINFGVKKGGVVGTVARFIASPLTVPIRRVAFDKIPADGSDACNVVLGPVNRSGLVVEGCK